MKLRLGLFAIFSIILFGAGPGPVQAKPKYAPYVEYGAKVHVAGGITITKSRDGLQDCQPGQLWDMELASDIAITGKVKVKVLNGKTVSSTFATKAGAAESNNSMTAYQESNYCPPEDPVELDKPDCRSIKGTGAVGLSPDPRRKGAPRVSVSVGRTSGDTQDLKCMVLPINSTPAGSDLNPLDTPYSTMKLPLDITAKQILRLGVKKKLIRVLNVGGPCDRAVVYRGKKVPFIDDSPFALGTSIYDHDTCEVDGTINVEIKRLTRGRN